MIPAVLFTKDLPGPLSMNRLAAFGTVHKLDESASYWSEHAGTLYGRATIVSTVAPFGTVACMQTAAWVWLGDAPFPASIDVISTSHFRSTSAGRRIRVFRRLTLPEQIIKLGSLPITTPTRTACDLVMTPEDDVTPSRINDLVCQLMSAYRFRPNDCLDIIKEHRHHKYAGRARLFFESIQREMNEVDAQPAMQPATQTSAQTTVLQTLATPERPSLTTAPKPTTPKPTTSEPTTSGESR
ncbi:hypothetical protein BG22_06235 [Bifidobacterium sp. UTBIF-78]|nr:hypothetical protein BG22_06235 [Bifidobacterium sp. UTBIF-78]